MADLVYINLCPSVVGGSSKPEEVLSETITENGEYTFTPTPGSVFSSANISVNVEGGSSTVDNNSFLFEADYDSLDYEYAYDYFEDRAPVEVTGFCSALVSENLVGRNLDWLYNNDVSFIVRTPHTIGISGGLGYSYEKMEQGLTDNEKKIIPFYLQDGINSSGLFAEMNVIPYNNVSSVGSGDRVCAIMLVRYILDNYSNVDDALTGIASKEIYLPQALIEQGYGLHFLLADSTKSVVVELTENGLQRFNSPILTNFSLYGVSFNEDGSVYTNADVPTHLPTDMGINEYGTGLERWNILNDAEISSYDDMRDTMKSVSFSNAYTKELGADFWYSEFVGGDYTINTPTDSEGFIERINFFKSEWENRDRENPTVWITTHTAIYDLDSLTITLTSQEHNAESEIMLYSPNLGTATVAPENYDQTATALDYGYDGFSEVGIEGYDVDEIYNALVEINRERERYGYSITLTAEPDEINPGEESIMTLDDYYVPGVSSFRVCQYNYAEYEPLERAWFEEHPDWNVGNYLLDFFLPYMMENGVEYPEEGIESIFPWIISYDASAADSVIVLTLVPLDSYGNYINDPESNEPVWGEESVYMIPEIID